VVAQAEFRQIRRPAAVCEVFERATRRYGKPKGATDDRGSTAPDNPLIPLVWESRFGRCLYFESQLSGSLRMPQPRVADA